MTRSSTSALVIWPQAPLTDSLVKRSLKKLGHRFNVISDLQAENLPGQKLLQWASYDSIDHELTHLRPEQVLSSSYTFRKGLIRKHFLSHNFRSYITKYPESVLELACPKSYELELCFAEDLDEMWQDELWEFGRDIESNASVRWWMLKPGMTDRGVGIRLFNSKEMLQKIFEEFEGEGQEESDGESNAVITSQLRHFVIQEYIINPLLLDPNELSIKKTIRKTGELRGHKFHLRVYCIALGALQIYVHNKILALFSAVPYRNPSRLDTDDHQLVDLTPHLTNTSLQTCQSDSEGRVRLFEEFVGSHILSHGDVGRILTAGDVSGINEQIADILGVTFKAALENPIHFQPLPNAFELYGVDFLVEHNRSPLSNFQVKILEINSEPAIELTGPRLTWILEDLFVAIGKVCVQPFFHSEKAEKEWCIGETRHNLTKCLNIQVGGPARQS